MAKRFIDKSINTILIFLFVFMYFNLSAQNDSTDNKHAFLSIGVKVHKGFIIPHSESIRSISYSKPWIIETEVSWHYFDIKSWQYCSCFPRIGITIMYINFDNQKILGNAFTFAPYVESFFTAHKTFNLSFKFMAGYAYLNNVYDPVKNPDNLFYSTHSSFILSAALAINYRIRTKWTIFMSANYNHISNGGNRLPNKGINFPTASIGMDYAIKPVHFRSYENAGKEGPTKRTFIKLGILTTFKRPFPQENTRYFLYGFYTNWSYLLGRLSAITAGTEYVNDGSLREELNRDSLRSIDHKRIGLLIGHELFVGRFRFSQQLGIYIYSPWKAKDPVYQRWGLDFKIYKGIYIGLNLKAHRHVADFMDFRVGYEW